MARLRNNTIPALVGLLAAVLFPACSNEASDARLSARFSASAPLSLAMVTVDVTDGTHQWQWTGSDFVATASSPTPQTPEHATRNAGTLQLRVQLSDGSVVVADGEVTLDLRSDWRWTIDIMTSTTDPRSVCFGCVGSRSVALPSAYRAAGRDSLWVVWGGNSIRNPVIY